MERFAGIDWSDESLDYQLRTAQGKVLAEGVVKPTADGLSDLFVALEAHGRPDQIGIAIETAHGAWVQAILDRGYVTYPVNPKTAEAFREALSAAGTKSDKIDRKVLALFLATCHAEPHPLRPDAPDIVAFRLACQDRVRLVEERTAKHNERQAILKAYYPGFLDFFGCLESRIALAFLHEFPTQDQMRALSVRRLRSWLKRHRYCAPQRADEMAEKLTARVLPVAEHLQTAKAPLIQYLARSLLSLQTEIAQREKQISRQLDALPEADWIRSLPGAGPTLAPALLACIGRDPERFTTTGHAQALMGAAPVTKASGRSRSVYFRRGCWKFARRTPHLFADHSRHHSEWAQTFYEKQRASGHRHHAALRALAHKWVKIILAMRRSGARYDEDIFLNSQQRYLLNSANAGT